MPLDGRRLLFLPPSGAPSPPGDRSARLVGLKIRPRTLGSSIGTAMLSYTTMTNSQHQHKRHGPKGSGKAARSSRRRFDDAALLLGFRFQVDHGTRASAMRAFRRVAGPLILLRRSAFCGRRQVRKIQKPRPFQEIDCGSRYLMGMIFSENRFLLFPIMP